MRNSETGKYTTLLTRTAVCFYKNYCSILASAVFLCRLRCLKWCCIAYVVCFAVFSVDYSSSRFKKTIEQRQTPAGWRAWRWHVCGRTYVAFLIPACRLCADCLGTFWKILATGTGCMITFGNLLENSVKLTVSLLFMVDCQMRVFILFIPLTLKEMLFKGGPRCRIVLRLASTGG